ncbi:MAG TPA: lipoxygenase family protein [Ilumatobacteraceae bacterium]|nr:lipoxygenase family protein [Ilumatobacteraceae bacterium]
MGRTNPTGQTPVSGDLAEQRDIWRFDHSWNGLVFPEPDSLLRAAQTRILGTIIGSPMVPETLDIAVGLGPRWLANGVAKQCRTRMNGIRARWDHEFDAPDERTSNRLRRAIDAMDDRVTRRIWTPTDRDGTPPPFEHRLPLTIDEFERSLPTLPRPMSFDRWQDDRYFAWQRLAGSCPVSLTWIEPGRVAEVLAEFPVSAEQFAATRSGDSLAAADEQGRLFLVNHAILDGIDPGVADGWRRWLPAVKGLFALTPDRSELWPVAIQCSQTPSPDHVVVTPADKIAWTMAKASFQVAEATWAAVAERRIGCHLVIGAITLAMFRNLDTNHPIRVLLSPHVEYTLAIDLATKDQLAAGGLIPELYAVSDDGCVELCQRAWKGYDWYERSMRREFARRGVADPDVLPDYPARDDLRRVGNAIEAFVTRYVALEYPDDTAVAADTQLAEWISEIQSHHGGRLAHIGAGEHRIDTIDALREFVADIIWRATAFHHAVTAGTFDSMGFVPNMPAAQFAPPPHPAEHDDGHHLAMLPPRSAMDRQITEAWRVSNTRLNQLGRYARRAFWPDADPLVESFRGALAIVEAEIDEANRNRYLPYLALRPSGIANSIQV